MTATVNIEICTLPHFAGLTLPNHATDLAAGVDLEAAIDAPITLQPGERQLIATGISIALPAGYEAQIRPRSGLAYKNGVTVLNSPGTIDADYRGEVKALLINHGQQPFVIERGMRIAQMVIAAHARVNWQQVETLSSTERGEGGFGSTGVRKSA